MKKVILNRTRNHSDRFCVLPGSMGCYGLPKTHANHHYQIANGIDHGRGYQGYSAVSYFLTSPHMDWVPTETRDNLRKFLLDHGFSAADFT